MAKTGRVEPEDLSDNIAVQLGIHTEQFNLIGLLEHGCSWWLSICYEKRLEGACEGYVDAMYNHNPVEAKHTNAYNNMDDVIKYYMPQLQRIASCLAEGIYVSNFWEQ